MLLAMEPMSVIELSEADKQICHKLALASIQYGLKTGMAIPVKLSEFPESVHIHAATFVTLEKEGMLRGCIGTLEAYQPLIKDIAEHAYAAAFRDPRFPAVTQQDVDRLSIKISVLTDPRPVEYSNQQDLLSKIQAGIDGLILEYGHHKGTFLPSVWEQVSDKEEFLNHLKLKAGLPIDWWDNDAKISRYETINF